MIGAGSTIVKDIPSHSLAYGNPAKIKKEELILNSRIYYQVLIWEEQKKNMLLRLLKIIG